jgi:ferric-dicitrate binding protein FerR (iron transport regulator)
MEAAGALWEFLSVGAVALFSFLAIASWSESRRREREAYYKSEAIRKLAESTPDVAASALDFLREQERNDKERVRAQIKIAGLVTCGVGIGMMVFLGALIREAPIYLSGSIPLLIGVALLAWSYIPALRD